MSGKKEHLKFGIGTSIATESVQIINDHKKGNKISIKDFFTRIGISGIFGALGSLLPDKLEPATNPNHRSYCHSILVGIGIIKLSASTCNSVYDLTNVALRSFGVGYLTHLVQDSLTTKGLPWIG